MKPLEIGVCSWSLAIKDLGKTLSTIRQDLRLRVVQVGFFGEAIPTQAEHDAIVQMVRDSGLEASATCVGFVGEDYSTIQRIAMTGGFVPNPLEKVVEYWPTVPEALITLGIWALGFFILSVLYKVAISIKEEVRA